MAEDDLVNSSQAVNINSQGVPGRKPMAEAHKKVEGLLCELRKGRKPVDNFPPPNLILFWIKLTTKTSQIFDVHEQSSLLRQKARNLMYFFCAQITGMVGTLNLYLNLQLSYTWHEASLFASKKGYLFLDMESCIPQFFKMKISHSIYNSISSKLQGMGISKRKTLWTLWKPLRCKKS
jgi:hypothetical protein